MKQSDFITLATAANALGMSPKTLKTWQLNGRLPVFRIGKPLFDCRGRDRRAVRVSRSQIESLIERPAGVA